MTNLAHDREVLSQRTVVQVSKVLDVLGKRGDMRELLYENDLPDWFVRQVYQRYAWNWMEALMDLRNGQFFYPTSDYLADEVDTIVPDDDPFARLTPRDAGEVLIRKLAAVAFVLLPEIPSRSNELSHSLPRSLQLDGYDVDKANIVLVPLEGPVSAKQEEDRLTKLVRSSGLPASHVALRHIEDASSLFAGGRDHPSLGESRNFIQTLIDGISSESDTHGGHSVKLPGGTGNRVEYLKNIGFLTNDEQSSFNSAWGSLSAGSHPGVPEREQARIGLVLALEFGQLLLIKFTNWRANAYRGFS
jgi:hypothetical protein